MAIQLCNTTQSPSFKAGGEITAMLGNCPTLNCLASNRNQIKGHLLHRDANSRQAMDSLASQEWTV